MDAHPPVKTKIETIYQAIHQYPERKYYIGELAKQAGLTPQAFNTAFKQYYGITVPQCITKAKMERAVTMLLAGHSIKQVTAALGYKQVINFHKTFKRVTGTTPGKYITLHRRR